MLLLLSSLSFFFILQYCLPFLDDDGFITYYINIECYFTETNLGFQMLKKAGWEEGKGLGSTSLGSTTAIGIGGVGGLGSQTDSTSSRQVGIVLGYISAYTI